ncbi:MAG: hypothetical protein KKB51_12775 [Candidatus Riflebacteria bacterium]|nr:hypothetical protein [Candidatus Riflebacteria bacterium]
MSTQASLSLPEAIRNDVSIYLAPGEKVLKAIKSSAERTASKGQVWLVLSSGSVFFHTCETGKEPVIALLSRREIREIEYFQRSSEVVLTFVPTRNPQNVTRLSFSNTQRPELEDFCDDLADLINFKKETSTGVKTFSATTTLEMSRPTAEVIEPPPSALRSTASAMKHSPNPTAENRPKVEPVAPSPAETGVKPEVKIVKSAKSIEAQPKTVSLPSSPVEMPTLLNADKSSVRIVEGMQLSYIIAATFISVLVAFLWYKFFSALSRMK